MSAKAAIKPLHAALALVLALAGCATPRPETATVVAQPKTPPVRNITSFSHALQCMDNLFFTHGVRNIMVTSAGIPDATGEISTGTKEMLITAVARMSVRSNAFRFIDYDRTQDDVHALHQLIDPGAAFVAPNYYIRGAITQLDENVLDANQGFGLALGGADFGYGKGQVVSLVTLDLNVGDFVSRQILPGLSANNTMAVTRRGQSLDAGGRVEKAGVFFNFALNRNEGMHQAVRNLVELGAIETLGKLTRVPYWQCLQLDSTNPEIQVEAREWYDTLTPGKRTTFVQRTLKGNGYYKGPVTGQLDSATREAITVYQQQQDLIPSGRIDFPLYLQLLGNTTRMAAAPAPEADPPRQASVPPERVPVPAPVTVDLLSDRGGEPVYRPAEALSLAVETDRNAYLYCYYQDARGSVARIYPNRFQPDALVPGGQALRIPGARSPFQIRFDRAGAREAVVCMASDRELGLLLPPELKAQDLTPLPVTGLDDLIARYRDLDGRLTVARMPITVSP